MSKVEKRGRNSTVDLSPLSESEDCNFRIWTGWKVCKFGSNFANSSWIFNGAHFDQNSCRHVRTGALIDANRPEQESRLRSSFKAHHYFTAELTEPRNAPTISDPRCNFCPSFITHVKVQLSLKFFISLKQFQLSHEIIFVDYLFLTFFIPV